MGIGSEKGKRAVQGPFCLVLWWRPWFSSDGSKLIASREKNFDVCCLGVEYDGDTTGNTKLLTTKSLAMTENTNRIKVHCNFCHGPRWHLVLFSKEQYHEEEDGDGPYYFERMVYRLAECNGCENITLLTSWTNLGQQTPVEEQWPPKISRGQPKWMFELFLSENLMNPFKQEFIREIYSSLKVGNLRLTVLGVRALLEQVMIEQTGDQGTFEKNLDKFQSEGFISRLQREALAPVIEAGHASMHRGFKASPAQVDAILDVTENIIESIYVSTLRSKNLQVPPRPPKPAKR